MTAHSAPDWRFLLAHPAHFVAFGFGSGLSPFAPGTAGTLVGFPLFALLSWWLDLAGLLVFVGLAFAAGVWLCEITGRALGIHDPGGIVWDEIVAFVLILAFTPATPLWWAAAFFLFRLFDVWKPFPIRWVDDHTTGGFGVMFDDLLAAVYTIAVLRGLIWLTA